jgi:hypothetical protein
MPSVGGEHLFGQQIGAHASIEMAGATVIGKKSLAITSDRQPISRRRLIPSLELKEGTQRPR